MGSLYVRGTKLWARYKDHRGKWVGAPTPYRAGEEEKARRFLAKLEAMTEATQTVNGGAGGGPVTVSRYAERWLGERRALGLAVGKGDDARLRRYALPVLGVLRLDEVRPRHIRDLVLDLRKRGELAPRTIRHVYGVLATMFRAAIGDELVDATPCVLQRGVLPKKADKDPAWRATAIFTREEVEVLVSDTRVPQDRRVVYALKALAGLRHGEAATLRWRQYDPELEPLGAINLEKTKTGVPRRVPVHPTLARVLAEWKLAGWERAYERPPGRDDLVVPARTMKSRDDSDAAHAFRHDLETLELRRRRAHDLRRTFITLALVDGARRDLLEVVTHGPRGDIISVYSTFPWPALCDEVSKLRISLREGQILSGDFATARATAQRKARFRWQKGVPPAGFATDVIRTMSLVA